MLTSFLNTHSEILKILTQTDGPSVIKLPYNGEFVNIPIRYARESVQTVAQKSEEIYPQVVIFDHFPRYDEDWNPNFQKYVDDYHNFTGTNNAPLQGYIFSEPLRFLLNYDFTLYVKNPMHRYAIMDYMTKRFGKMGSMCLNKVSLPDGDLGDFVTYTCESDENERKDGVFELFYSFTIKPFINLTDPKECELITNFNLNITSTS